MAAAGSLELTDAAAVRPRRSLHVTLRTTVLNVSAAAGALCIAWVVAALVLHLSLIMFRTGSMAPTIPAGSLALVMQVPAGEVQPGEVVTVDRPGLLPITHRVVGVHRSARGPETTLVLKGDANATADPSPYTVTTVRRVLWAAPGLAAVIVWWSNPLVLLATTVLVAALVTWAFWPRAHPRRRPPDAPA